jgi:hypothetical protein
MPLILPQNRFREGFQGLQATNTTLRLFSPRFGRYALEFKPEQERMIQEHLASGQFKSVDEVLTTDRIRE